MPVHWFHPMQRGPWSGYGDILRQIMRNGHIETYELVKSDFDNFGHEFDAEGKIASDVRRQERLRLQRKNKPKKHPVRLR